MSQIDPELVRYLLSNAEQDKDFKKQFGDVVSRLSLFNEVYEVVRALEARAQVASSATALTLNQCLVQLVYVAATRLARLHADKRFSETGDLRILSEELFAVLGGSIAPDAIAFTTLLEKDLRSNGPAYAPYVSTVAPPSLRLVGYDPRIKVSNGKIDAASFNTYYDAFCKTDNTIAVAQELSTTYALGRRLIDQSVTPFGKPADIAIVDLASVPDLAHRNTIYRLNELSTDIQHQLQKEVVDEIFRQFESSAAGTPATTGAGSSGKKEFLNQLIDRLCSADTGLYALPCWINNHVIISGAEATSLSKASESENIYEALLALHPQKLVPVQTRAGSCITYELYAHFASENYTPIIVVEGGREIRIDIDREKVPSRRALAAMLHRVLAFQANEADWKPIVGGDGDADWAVDHEGEAKIIDANLDTVDFSYPTELLGKLTKANSILHVPAVSDGSGLNKAFTSIGGYGLVIPRSCRDPYLALKKIREHAVAAAKKTTWHAEFGKKRDSTSKAWDDTGLFNASLGYIADRVSGHSKDHTSRLDRLVRPRIPFWRELEQHFTTAIEELVEAWPRPASTNKAEPTSKPAHGAFTLPAVFEWLERDTDDVPKIIERLIRRIRDTASDFGWNPVEPRVLTP